MMGIKERVTQGDIADIVGIDVSSVNKILNRTGGVFRKDTIAKVFRVAERLGYDQTRPTKVALLAVLREIAPESEPAASLARRLNVSVSKAEEIKRLVKRRTSS
jgi:transcriptional regulator with XRE-family HTH domain